MRKLILSLILLASTGACFSQTSKSNKSSSASPTTGGLSNGTDYSTAVGMRLIFDGPTPCLTVKHLFKNNHGAEFAVGFPDGGGTFVEGLYGYHGNFVEAPGFKWYTGAGVLGAFPKDSEEAYLGVPLIAGLEYKIKGGPIAFGLDWQPLIWISDVEDRFDAKQFGLTLRLAFK